MVLAVAGLAFAGFALWQAHRALTQAQQQVATQGQIAFSLTRLDRKPPSQVEYLSAPAAFTDAAEYRGSLYLAGPAGLFEYDGEGKLRNQYRVGLELPAAPVTHLATGVAADSNDPELFLATRGQGLLAFDGRRFRQLLPQDAGYRTITAVLPLSTGRILLGTEKHGLLVYDGKHLTPFHASLANLYVTALAGNDADLWVGTLNRGLLHWRAGQVEEFSEASGMPDPQVLSLAASGDAIYAGTPVGVDEFRAGRFARLLAHGFFAQSLMVQGETLLVGTLEEGTLEVPLGTRRVISSRPRGQALPGAVQKIFDVQGTTYALAEDGLYAGEKTGGSWRRVLAREPGRLTDRNIAALDVDAAGKIWVGYFDRGLDILEPGRPARHLEDAHVFCVNRIVHDDARGLSAVATANGLVLFDVAGRERQVLGREQGLIADHVTDVALTRDGMIAGTPAGLTFIGRNGMSSLYAFQGLINNHAYALGLSGDHLLVGTLGGLSILQDGVVQTSYTTANSGLKANWITALVPVGDEWFVGTYGAGILRLDSNGRWQTFDDASASFEVNPNAMLVTPTRVYAGTLGRGLYVYDRESGRWTVISAGLPSGNVTALAASGGSIYVGTDNGLVRFPEGALF